MWICSYRQWFIDQQDSEVFQKGGVEKISREPAAEEQSRLQLPTALQAGESVFHDSPFNINCFHVLIRQRQHIKRGENSSRQCWNRWHCHSTPPASCLGRSSLYPVIKMAWVQADSHTTHSLHQRRGISGAVDGAWHRNKQICKGEAHERPDSSKPKIPRTYWKPVAFRFISSWKYKRKTSQIMTYMCKIKAWFGIESQHDLFVLLVNALLSIFFLNIGLHFRRCPLVDEKITLPC